MSSFNTAVRVVLDHEGGYVNNKKDPGGETNFGISKRAYPNVDIKNLTRKDAAEIYKRDYWNKVRGDYLPFGVALVVFDMAVNMGVRQSVKILQKVIGVKDDGVFGDKTLSAALALTPQYVCEELTKHRIMYYTKLNGFLYFGKGWVGRSIEVLGTALLIRDYDV